MNRDIHQKGLSGMLAMLLVVSAVVGAVGVVSASTTGTFDTETTSTSTTSEVTSGSMDMFTFSPGSSGNITVETDGVSVSKDRLEVRVFAQDANATTALWTTSTWTATNSSAGHFAADIPYSAVEKLPNGQDAGLYTVKVIDTDTGDVIAEGDIAWDPSETITTSEVAVTSNAGDATADTPGIADSYSSEAKDAGRTISLASKYVPKSIAERVFGASVAAADVTDVVMTDGHTSYDGSNSTIRIESYDATAFADSLNNSASELSEGDRIPAMLEVNGESLAVYKTSAPSDVDKNSTSYAVYNPSSDTIVVHPNGDTLDGMTSAQFSLTAGEDYADGVGPNDGGIFTFDFDMSSLPFVGSGS